MKIFFGNYRKISTKLTFLYGFLFFLTIVSVSIITLVSIHFYMNQSAEDQVTSIYQSVIAEVNASQDVTTYDFNEFIQVYDNVELVVYLDQVVIFNSGENSYLPVYSTAQPMIVNSSNTTENSIVIATSGITLSNQSLLQVQVIKNMDNEQDYLKVLTFTTIAIDMVVFMISIAVGYLISRRALSPIDSIISQAKDISVNDLSKRLEIKATNDELSRLADTFNEMFSRIQYSYNKQSEFTLNASHELATPLSIIKGYIDVIDRWGKEDKAVLEEAITSIKKELLNMTKLMDSLFVLSKSDNDIIKLDRSSFWFNELIEEVIQGLKIVDQSHEIIFTSTEPLQYYGDQKLLKEMLRGILDNSLKYTPELGKISISLEKSDGQVEIMIQDSGIGIPKEDIPHIFDRFYRVDKSRSREVGGTGLGLSIVKWICEVHGGTVTIDSVYNEGTSVILRFPLEK